MQTNIEAFFSCYFSHSCLRFHLYLCFCLRLNVCRLRHAASKAIAEGDPWAKHNIDKVPAERVIRHMYQPATQTWKQDETIVKMEKKHFTHGAMRFCYRMKKRSPPPQSASNHRFHNYGWTRASNYVAKAYQDEKGEIDTSDEAKQNVKNDILLQYEASHWADRFNRHEPPKKIVFIRAYAMEFPDREGKPWFAVERYIFGSGKLNEQRNESQLQFSILTFDSYLGPSLVNQTCTEQASQNTTQMPVLLMETYTV